MSGWKSSLSTGEGQYYSPSTSHCCLFFFPERILQSSVLRHNLDLIWGVKLEKGSWGTLCQYVTLSLNHLLVRHLPSCSQCIKQFRFRASWAQSFSASKPSFSCQGMGEHSYWLQRVGKMNWECYFSFSIDCQPILLCLALYIVPKLHEVLGTTTSFWSLWFGFCCFLKASAKSSLSLIRLLAIC